MLSMNESTKQRHHVVVIGSGFGGLFSTKALKDASVDVTVIAKTNHHLFQPLLYQVATGILSGGAIAPPTREILRGQRNVEVRLGEVIDIDIEPDALAAWLTFVVVGAGLTGVEMAGQIAELAHRTLRKDYRRVDPERARVVLLDRASTVLGTFGDRLAAKASKKLEQLGVEVQLGAVVVDVDECGIDVKDPDGSTGAWRAAPRRGRAAWRRSRGLPLWLASAGSGSPGSSPG